MKTKIALAAAIIPVLILSSCTIRLVDQPDYYYDYDDTTKVNPVYGSYNYGYAAAVPTATPVKTVYVPFIVLKVVQNNYYFYENDVEVAVWRFKNDGSVIRNGKVITGIVKRFYDGSNIIESEINYRNGERWGACKKFYPNGLLKEVISYYKGKRHGDFKFYYPNGRLIEEGAYNDGKRHGWYKKYLETGDIDERGDYKYDVPNIKYKRQAPTPVATAYYRVPVVITVVVTPTPVPVQPAVTVVVREQVPVFITVVVTATVEPVATVTMHDDHGNHYGLENKQDNAEQKDFRDAVKEEIKEQKEEYKEDYKENKEAVKEEQKDMREAVKEEIKEEKQELKEIKEAAKEDIKALKSGEKQTEGEIKEKIKDGKSKSKGKFSSQSNRKSFKNAGPEGVTSVTEESVTTTAEEAKEKIKDKNKTYGR